MGDWQVAQSRKITATEELHRLWAEARERCGESRSLARLVLKGREPLKLGLGLKGKEKRSLSGWLDQTRQFYHNVVKDEALLAELYRFGVTAERLAEERQLVTGVEAAWAEQKKRAAEAMRLTRERRTAFRQLGRWMREFFTIAQMALGDSQLLEGLGIVVK
jgi:hypothetical protein